MHQYIDEEEDCDYIEMANFNTINQKQDYVRFHDESNQKTI